MRPLQSGSSAAWPALVLALLGATLSLTAQAPPTVALGPNAPFDFAIKRHSSTSRPTGLRFDSRWPSSFSDRPTWCRGPLSEHAIPDQEGFVRSADDQSPRT